jgi:hypothetical protein
MKPQQMIRLKNLLITLISVGKEIKAFIPAKFKGPAFHCPAQSM